MSIAPIDPQTLGMLFAGFGVVEFGTGTWQAQSPGPQRGIAYVLQSSGLGFLAAGPILYWSWDDMQSLIVAMGVAAAGTLTGYLRLRSHMQATSGDQQ